jgi:NitT/TauT family transport system permease protein
MSYLPDPKGIISLFLSQPHYYLYHWLQTFQVSISACCLALFTTLVLLAISLRYGWIGYVFNGLAAITQSFPLQAIAPLLLIILGIGFGTKLLIAFLICFFPLYGSLSQSLRKIEDDHGLLICSTGAKFVDATLRVRLPALLPDFLASAKVAFTLSVLGAVVAEFVQPNSGLGYVILVSQSSFNLEAMYLCVFLLIIQGLSVFSIASYFEMRSRRARGI